MTEAAEKKPGGGRTVLMLAGLAIAVLGAVTLWLYRGVERSREGWERSCQEYDKMVAMKKTVVDLRQKAGGGKKIQPPPDNPADLASFFNEKARQAQIGNLGVKPPPRGSPWQGSTEFAYALSVSKDGAVTRSSWVNFLVTIERDRPYLKAKDLSLNFEDNGAVWGSATVSFFKSEPGK